VSGPVAAWLPDGRRLHLRHGPIEVIAECWGAEEERRAAYRQIAAAFDGMLEGLVAELPALRRPADEGVAFRGPVARRMAAAVAPHRGVFVTPMAAVAGAVADELLAAATAGRRLTRAYVNDGGDAALHLAPGEAMRAALAVEDAAGWGDAGRAEIRAETGVRGIATSGRRGRSLSFGIADAVTVLAADAASADVAATLIANAVDLPGHAAIRRGPASAEDPDSDLGDRLVTLSVGPLTPQEARAALARGAEAAEGMRRRGLIAAAFLALQGERETVGAGALVLPSPVAPRERV
jgi:ApbE superfamily uncharacterized protein (UPF0280 family)